MHGHVRLAEKCGAGIAPEWAGQRWEGGFKGGNQTLPEGGESSQALSLTGRGGVGGLHICTYLIIFALKCLYIIIGNNGMF